MSKTEENVWKFKLKITVFQHVLLCSLVEVYQHFGGADYLHHQGDDSECQSNTVNKAMTTSFHSLSNLLFFSHPVIWCKIIWASDIIIKQTTNK
jgi:hypothetical protein